MTTENSTASQHTDGRAGAVANGVIARLRDRLIASDPAYSRLRLAARAMLSLALSGAVLAGLTFIHRLPIASYGLAVIVSFLGSMAVRETTWQAQFLTRLAMGGGAIAAVLIASLVASKPLVADLAFLAVIFVSVYVRRFGARWFAAGMIAFMAYFMADYLRASPADIGWIALATALALLVTQFVTTVALRGDAERDFRRAMGTMDRRINLILRHLADNYGENGARRRDADRAMRRHIARLREITLMAEGFIPHGPNGPLAAEGPAADLAAALFDLQLAVERLVRARHQAVPPAAMIDIVLSRGNAEELEALERAMEPQTEVTRAGRLLLRVHHARRRVAAALGSPPSPAFAPPPDDNRAAHDSDTSKQEPQNEPRPLVPESLQRPVQITLACAAAISVGLMLSPTRWYWAVIAAFIVFNNTRSRADTAIKALQRSAGTLGGLFAGTLFAVLLQGHMVASAVAIPLLFFLAFYFVQTSYGVMIFLVTIALALIYGLMGMFTPQLLVVRLEETVVGAVAGTAAAFLVFPVRASTGVAQALDAYLAELKSLLDGACAAMHGGDVPRADLVATSRALDRRYSELAAAARPLGGPWNAVTRFGQVREKLLLLAGCVHWARVLAQTLAAGHVPPEGADARIDALCTQTDERIARIRGASGAFFESRRDGGDRLDTPPPRYPLAIAEEENPVYALEAIAEILGRARME